MASSYFTSSNCRALCSTFRCCQHRQTQEDTRMMPHYGIFCSCFWFKNKQTIQKKMYTAFKTTQGSQSIGNALLCTIFSQLACMTLLWWKVYLKVTHFYCDRNQGSVLWNSLLWKWAMAVLWKVRRPTGQKVCTDGSGRRKSDLCIKASAALSSALPLSMMLSMMLGKSLEPNYSCVAITFYSLSESLTWAWIGKVLRFHHCVSCLWELCFESLMC